MGRKLRIVLFAVLALAVMWFIFGNSLEGAAESNSKSGTVAELLRPLLDPQHRLSEETFNKLIRKLAHFAEFAALGFFLCGVSVNIRWRRLSPRFCAPLLAAVLIASADETIQRFTGRTSMVKDVLLDTAGALTGIVLMLLLWTSLRRSRKTGGQ